VTSAYTREVSASRVSISSLRAVRLRSTVT
jgi:hypothetical protein